MSRADKDPASLAHQALWVSRHAHQHYSLHGQAVQVEAVYELHAALEAIESKQDARKIAHLLQQTAPAGSELKTHLHAWWLASVQQDSAMPAPVAPTLKTTNMSLAELQHWHDETRHDPELRDLGTQLAATFKQRLSDLAPTDAWKALEDLRYRWDHGRPAILLPNDPVRETVFARYAEAEPYLASFAATEKIKTEPSLTERHNALVAIQQTTSGLSSFAQLLFLGELHARLLHEPELAGPSRAHLIKLHQQSPENSATDKLYELAQGDDVLRNTLKPIVTTLPPRPPSLTARLMKRLNALLS